MSTLKNILYALVFLPLLGCSSKISEYFEQNQYVEHSELHIINDSLQLYLKTPANITFIKNKKELKKVISQRIPELQQPVLLYGKNNEQAYEFFVTISKNPLPKSYSDHIVYDTLLPNHAIRLIGRPLNYNAKKEVEIELTNIFQSIEIGPSYTKQSGTVFDIVSAYQESSQFYAALNEIKEFQSSDKQEQWAKLQMELTFSSFLADNKFYQSYLNDLESRFKSNDTISNLIRENAVYNSQVIDTIIHQAKKHQIIMINENHYYPNHRLLVIDLLEQLKENGYQYLALEALEQGQDEILNIPESYPTLQTGFYTREQTYAHLLRKAKKLGFEFIAYENFDHQNRELGQAENLYDKTFKVNPTSKVIVVAGIDHIIEKPTSTAKEWMASIFKKKYNIDPLTISQTHLNSYRKQIDADYGIVNSDIFSKVPLSSIDYLVLNNRPNDIKQHYTDFYHFQNKEDQDLQVALFYGDEIKSEFQKHNNLPYFTTILEAGKKYELPIDKKQDIYLYLYDIKGKTIHNQTIKRSNK